MSQASAIPAGAPAAQESDPSEPPPDDRTSANARIVVIDDEPLNSAELEAFLRALGYRQVVTFVPDADALDAVRNERPDVILLELTLHQPTAFDVLGWLNGDRALRHVPVIAITAQDERSTRLRALELGVSDYLVKPVDPSDFELRLRNTLATKFHHDRLAYTDGLTGLPNRESALHRLEWALRFAQRHGMPGAVLQVGLGRFREINDALGPALGDELLRAVSLRLVNCLRVTDVVARDAPLEAAATAELTRGDGNEFTVLLPTMEKSDHSTVVANRIVESMSTPFMLAGQELYVSCQVGIAVFGGETLDKDVVLRQAKLAMNHARAAGEGVDSGFRFYSQELHGRASSRLATERELHHALDRGELVLHFQPKVELASGRICGAEALVRWQHPRRGLLGPSDFIEVAEESGLIVPLGEWVLHEALRQMASWRQPGAVPPTVAVNVSSLQLRRPHLDRTVGDALARAGLDGSSLHLELTESVMMQSGSGVTGALHAIKELGVRLSLDDFGTGYSSLSYLRRLPIDELKIDSSFVVECHAEDGGASIITRAIIAMAHGLRLRVVAEGVETRQQLDFLRRNACDQYQGFLYSKPVPASEFQALLARADIRVPRAVAPDPDADRLACAVNDEFSDFPRTVLASLLPN